MQTTLRTFTDHYSPSVQNTLYRMGKAVLERFPEVARIWYSFPNVHHIPYDLERFGIENDRRDLPRDPGPLRPDRGLGGEEGMTR